jgi:hypothetical protein
MNTYQWKTTATRGGQGSTTVKPPWVQRRGSRMETHFLVVEEDNGTTLVYDERGVLENHFANLQEAQAWINYRNREEAASPKIAERAEQRAFPRRNDHHPPGSGPHVQGVTTMEGDF